MPVAQLHNGTQIAFPDGTPDHEIDAAVQRHLGVGQQPAAPGAAPDGDLMGAIMQAIAAHSQSQQTAKGQQDQQNVKSADLHHKTQVITAAAHVDATKEVAAAMAQGFQQIAGPIAALADEAEANNHQLVMAVNNLSDNILKVGMAIIAALHTPKDSVIYHDANGKPKGVKSVRLKQGVMEPPSGSPPEKPVSLM